MEKFAHTGTLSDKGEALCPNRPNIFAEAYSTEAGTAVSQIDLLKQGTATNDAVPFPQGIPPHLQRHASVCNRIFNLLSDGGTPPHSIINPGSSVTPQNADRIWAALATIAFYVTGQRAGQPLPQADANQASFFEALNIRLNSGPQPLNIWIQYQHGNANTNPPTPYRFTIVPRNGLGPAQAGADGTLPRTNIVMPVALFTALRTLQVRANNDGSIFCNLLQEFYSFQTQAAHAPPHLQGAQQAFAEQANERLRRIASAWNNAFPTAAEIPQQAVYLHYLNQFLAPHHYRVTYSSNPAPRGSLQLHRTNALHQPIGAATTVNLNTP